MLLMMYGIQLDICYADTRSLDTCSVVVRYRSLFAGLAWFWFCCTLRLFPAAAPSSSSSSPPRFFPFPFAAAFPVGNRSSSSTALDDPVSGDG